MDSIVIADSDILIATYLKADILHIKTISLTEKLLKNGTRIIFPSTAIPEAITALHRKFSNPAVAGLLNRHYKEKRFEIEYITEEVMQKAAEIYDSKGSKQNTFFDAIVAATANQFSTHAIFSFDSLYK